jgi:hypothetical protein
MTAAIAAAVPAPTAKFVYNHDIMNCTADGVVGNQLYSGRALGITEPQDKIQLHEKLKPLWADIVAHYQRIGLPHTEDVIWSLDLRELGAHIGYQPSVFYYGNEENRYWGDSRWLDTVEYINSKNNFIEMAEELGVDVPKTFTYDTAASVNCDEFEHFVFPCYLKAAVSVSGVGIYRCENQEELKANLKKFDSPTPVQIQEEIKADTFLNLQYMVIDNHLVRLAASEQILDGFAHKGNRYPARHAPWHVVDPIAERLMMSGIRGIFAFDVAVVQTERGLRFPAIECNPRFNGASYPTLVARRLGISQWSAISMETWYRDLSEIFLRDIEYNPETGEGVIIVNWGTVLEGRLVILMAGSPEKQRELELQLLARL